MATYQSVQSATSNDTGSLTITKPVSLAVGDWMVACILADRDEGSTATLNNPAGWTVQESWAFSNWTAMKLFSKVADSSDVAASNFTFTAGGSTSNIKMSGHIVRITNVAFSSGVTMSADSTTGNSITAATFTPTRGNTLMLGFFGLADTGGTPGTSTFSIATDNPTWTNQASNTQTGEITGTRLTFYTATRTQSTATGTLTGTTTEQASNRGAVAIIALAPVVNSSYTVEATKINAYALTPIQSARLDAVAEAPTTDTRVYTGWTNPDKPSTTWTNIDK